MAVTRLVDEVWARERCAGCGLCVAACSKQVLDWAGDEHPRKRSIYKTMGLSRFEMDTCAFCQRFCEAVCPRLEPASQRVPLATVSARASGVLGGGEPNDVVRNLLIAARARGLIDGALLVDADRAGRAHARIARSAGEIAEAAGFQMLWTPVLDALNQAVFELELRSLAVVGTPCTAQALQRLFDNPVPRLAPYRKALRLSIAMFCTGVYSPEAMRDMLSNGMGLAPEQVRRVTALPRAGLLRAQLWDGSVREMDLARAERYTRAGCARCDDYLGESADIAVGTAGAHEGCSTLVVRSTAGLAAVQNATGMKLIETLDDVDALALEQASAEKDRRTRAQAFDDLQVMMLDALADPRKRAEVKQKFDMMYGGSRSTPRKEDYRYAGCGDCSGC